MSVPLIPTKEGAVASIIRVGGREKVKRHLGNMGPASGANMTTVSANNGSVIVSVKESRIAISKEMVSRIMI